MTDKRKINYVCPHCGGALCFDASAYWDAESQQWELGDLYDNRPTCGDCGEECTQKVIDFETGEELGQAPRSFEWITKAEADAAWQAFHAENAAKREAARKEESALALAKANAEALAANGEFYA